MFVIGDMVETIEKSTGFAFVGNGARGVVTGVDRGDRSVKVSTDNGNFFWAYEDRLRKVNDPVAQAKKLLEDAGYTVKTLDVVKDVAWRLGDVVDYKYTQNGTWYTFVKGAPNWPGDDLVNAKLATGLAKPVVQADPDNDGASVPFDQSRLV